MSTRKSTGDAVLLRTVLFRQIERVWLWLDNYLIYLRVDEQSIERSNRCVSIRKIRIEMNSELCIQDTQIENYDVPKGTMIIPLQWAIHTDPSYWDDPLSFKPERFIAEDGSLIKPKAFLPYQTGKFT